MSRTVNIFIDLEETVINEWGKSPTFLPHCGRINTLLKLLNPRRVQIFSFAIHTPEEEQEFEVFIQADLEHRMGRIIDKVIPVRDMFTISVKAQRTHFLDLSDFLLTRGKEGAFHDWCHVNHAGETSVLIDDVVPNRTTIDHDTKTKIVTLNVTALNKGFWRE